MAKNRRRKKSRNPVHTSDDAATGQKAVPSMEEGETEKTKAEASNVDVELSDEVRLIPIAAIGASAGGLEPIETFFDAMPVDSGCAFVIIQHLSPDFRSLMDELLARHSSMNIHRVSNGMVIEPNSIYLNPPRTIMTIDGNTIRLEEIDDLNSVYLPIDLFFQSLAETRKAASIGLVLSGTGSDGTRGCEAINNVGGSVLVQDPETTRFDGMPKSVIAKDNYTVIASPAELAGCVTKLLENEPLSTRVVPKREPLKEPLQDLLSMLKHQYGTAFEEYKEATVKRRIERRAQMRRITDINDYRDLLNTDATELQELYADLLIEVTEFFRDKAAFDVLQQTVFPELINGLNDGDPLRVWVPGCASGEEAYSIAILLLEQARLSNKKLHYKILATDIHMRSMNKASSGIYAEDVMKGVPAELVERYFDRAEGQVQVKPKVRNAVFFSTPFTRIDLISCRNLLIYLKDAAQEKVMHLLHFALRKDGFLFLGPSEHIGAISHEFESVDEKWRIFKKRRDIKLLTAESIFQRTDINSDIANNHRQARLSSIGYKANLVVKDEDSVPYKRAQRAALEQIVETYAPPGFLLTASGNVAHIFGKAGELLPMHSGSFSKKIVDLIKPSLKVIVTAALDHARSTEFNGFKRTAYVKDDNGVAQTYEVSLQELELPGEIQRFMLLSIAEKAQQVLKQQSGEPTAKEFASHESTKAMQQQILMLEHSLQSSEESLQSTIEELETSNEELQSTNEELMSTNEELQSTNEELHSVNEELYTVSAEHQRNNEELTERDQDLELLLQLSKIGTVHLDEELRLVRFTKTASNIFNIMPQDVGRPFSHITARVIDHDISAMVNAVSENGQTLETELIVNDETYLLRILSDQQENKKLRGVLITVIDISDLQHVKSELQERDIQYKDIVDNIFSFIVRWDATTNVIQYCNQRYASRWNSTVEELIGKNIVNLRPLDERPAFVNSLLDLRPGNSQVGIFTVKDNDGRKHSARISTTAISTDGKTISAYQSRGVDVTEELQYRETIEKLSSNFSDVALNPADKLESLLRIGLDFYGLDTAFIAMIEGDEYTITTAVSNVEIPYSEGALLDLDDTICGQFIEKQSSILIDDLSNSEINQLPCHRKTGIESFVGASVQTPSGLYGSVSFSSTKPRNRPFSAGEENFALMISGWIGYLIGTREQLNFMENKNDYYKSLLANVPTMLLLTDSQGLILSASDQFSTKVGKAPHTIPGLNSMNFFDEQDREVIEELIRKGVVNTQAANMCGDNGETFEVELNIESKFIGTLQGTRIITITDVTQRNQASREAKEKNDRLQAANENLNQFAFIASHDLQEPLRKIQQFSSFLEEDLSEVLNDDARYHLDVIVDASERMSTLIHDLLRYSVTSKVDPQMETVNLEVLLADVLQELQMAVDESEAHLKIESMPTVRGNPSLLRLLFTNLISNSLKYKAQNRRAEITVKGVGKDYKEGIIVADNGIGFEMSYAKKIFEPFTRLHNNKEYKGTGIGLAICSTVCEKHGWKLEAESVPDKGSKFVIAIATDDR
jgi:two-component system CheB/CheR fusion protein